MTRLFAPFSAALFLASCVASLSAQNAIPAKDGLVDYTQGSVYLGDRPIEPGNTRFSEWKQDGIVRTGHGRAEILLGACTAIWIGEQSSLRLLSGNPADARVELLQGSAVIAVGATPKGSQLSIVTRSATVSPGRKGFYRFDMGPPRLKVTSGNAIARWSGEMVPVGPKHALALDGAPNVVGFDPRDRDALDAWSKARSAILVRAGNGREQRMQASRVDAAAAQAAGDQPRPVLDGEYPVISATTNGPPPPSPIPDTPRRALPAGFGLCGW